MNKILVDTDVLSAYFGRNKHLNSRYSEAVEELFAEKDALAISGHVFQEILYGIKTGQVGTYRKIKGKLSGLFIAPSKKEFELAVKISRKCTTNGIQLSIADLINCALSVSRGWSILAIDGDYVKAKQHESRIKLL